MSISNISLKLYRKTVKRFRPAHVAIHWLMMHGTIPLLETATGFHTMSDDPFWFRLELLTRRHELETIACLDKLARPGSIMLDVGAHVGYYSHRYAKILGQNGRIFAFEPHPRTFATLQRNLRRSPNVTPVQVALAETEGTAELHDYLMMSASGSLHYDESMVNLQNAQVTNTDIAPRIASAFAAQTYTVRTRPADAYLMEQGIRNVDLIKMDIEGAEISALRGMKKTIANSPDLVLVMEYNPQALRAFGHKPETAITEVLAMGFRRAQVIEGNGRLTDLTQAPDQIKQLTQQLMTHMGVVNLLFMRA
jgi:FkbM family methyltransferase